MAQTSAQLVPLEASTQFPSARYVDWLQVQGFLDMAESALRAKNTANDVRFGSDFVLRLLLRLKRGHSWTADSVEGESDYLAAHVAAVRAECEGSASALMLLAVWRLASPAICTNIGGQARSSRGYHISQTAAGGSTSGMCSMCDSLWTLQTEQSSKTDNCCNFCRKELLPRSALQAWRGNTACLLSVREVDTSMHYDTLTLQGKQLSSRRTRNTVPAT